MGLGVTDNLSKQTDNNNNLLKSTPNFIKPKMEILFAQLIVSPAATEQRQIDVALSPYCWTPNRVAATPVFHNTCN